MVEGGVVLLDVGFALGKNCRATAQALHQPIAHLVIKLIAEEQLLEDRHLLGDGVLVGEGGNCAKHFPRRDRVRWVLWYVAVHHIHHLQNLTHIVCISSLNWDVSSEAQFYRLVISNSFVDFKNAFTLPSFMRRFMAVVLSGCAMVAQLSSEIFPILFPLDFFSPNSDYIISLLDSWRQRQNILRYWAVYSHQQP